MRVALHSLLLPGQERAYERAHAAVPPEMVAALQEAGVRDWGIWRSGDNLFHVVDCTDFESTMAALAEDPRNHRWLEQMSAYVGGLTPDLSRLTMAHVWTLTGQLEADPPIPPG